MDNRRVIEPLDLATNPLVFVLGQVVFSPVLRMGTTSPSCRSSSGEPASLASTSSMPRSFAWAQVAPR